MTKHIIAIDADEIEDTQDSVPLSIEDALKVIEAVEILDEAPDADDPFAGVPTYEEYVSYEQYLVDAFIIDGGW